MASQSVKDNKLTSHAYRRLILNLTHDLNLSPKLVDAALVFPRYEFLPDRLKPLAHLDRPLPITTQLTTSQPYTILFMLKILNPQPKNSILEIGTGAAWQTALLAFLAPTGVIHTYEVDPTMLKLARKNIKHIQQKAKELNLQIADIHLHSQNALNYLKGTPHIRFDRIISGAAFPPEAALHFSNFLADNGKAVIPTTAQNLLIISKLVDSRVETQTIPGFIFVPAET